VQYNPPKVRRLARILLNALTVLSLLLCVATIVLWMRSGLETDGRVVMFLRSHGPDQALIAYSVESQAGRIRLEGGRYVLRTTELRWFDSSELSRLKRPMGDWSRANPFDLRFASSNGAAGGIEWGGTPALTQAAPDRYRWLTLPHWYVAAATGLWPAARSYSWLRRSFRRRRRARIGLCPVCGYDLRATPDRCPECGHSTARRATV
jgi:hypothetical protein